MKNHMKSDQEGDEEIFVGETFLETPAVSHLREQLTLLIKKQVAANVIDEQDAMLLLFRLGLEDGKCYTLTEISKITNISPESLRQRQHFALYKKISNPIFFKLLEQYSHVVKLPRGIRYYLHEVE